MTKNSKKLVTRLDLDWVFEGVSITKYNPTNRSEIGYHRDEWTSYFDIGKVFDGTKLSYIDYLITENKYIHAANLFFKFIDKEIENVILHNIEINVKTPKEMLFRDQYLFSTLNDIQSGKKEYCIFEACNIISLILRNYAWAIIQIPESESYISFSDNYYMYFTNRKSKEFESGLTIEMEKLDLFFW